MKDKNQRERGFDQVPNNLARGMFGLSDRAFRLYIYLHSLGSDFEPTQRTVAIALKWKKSKVERAYAELQKQGYLALNPTRKGAKQTYFVLEKPLQKKVPEKVECSEKA